jgi:predicted nuclease of predicted toxin-antitoxin system
LKLLFDANLSPKLVGRLREIFPDSLHVFDSRLGRATSDATIWDYASANGFAIVTADSDFLTLAHRRGAPPFVIRLQNCSFRTAQVETLLRKHALRIVEMETSERAVLIIRNNT